MKYLILSTILSSALLTTAAPTSTSQPLDRRACSVAYPQTNSFPINLDIRQDANGANARTETLTFSNLPAGAYGCQLEVNFPINYPITSSGVNSVNVYAETGPSKGSLFGTVKLANNPKQPIRIFVNSAKCESTMAYRLKIASDTLAGRVAFADTKQAGFTITYNC